jgi:hypothetical protein
VFQFYNLIPSLTARENVSLVTDLVDNVMTPEEALTLVGLADRMRHFPAEASLSALDAALATARAAQRQREFEIQTVEAALIAPGTAAAGDRAGCCIQLRAPVHGQLLRVLQENESIVMPGQPIAEVGDPANLEIVVDLVFSEAVQVADGDGVIISQWGGQGDLQGRVRRVEPFGQQMVSARGIEERRVDVVIDIVSPRNEWARLGRGFQVKASIVRWRGENVLQVGRRPVPAGQGLGGLPRRWQSCAPHDGRDRPPERRCCGNHLGPRTRRPRHPPPRRKRQRRRQGHRPLDPSTFAPINRCSLTQLPAAPVPRLQGQQTQAG